MISNKIQKTFISPVKVPEENSFNFLRLVCCLIVIYEHCVVLSGVNFPCYDLRGIAVKVFFYFKRILGYAVIFEKRLDKRIFNKAIQKDFATILDGCDCLCGWTFCIFCFASA